MFLSYANTSPSIGNGRFLGLLSFVSNYQTSLTTSAFCLGIVMAVFFSQMDTFIKLENENKKQNRR